jgi:hypothetical protein
MATLLLHFLQLAEWEESVDRRGISTVSSLSKEQLECDDGVILREERIARMACLDKCSCSMFDMRLLVFSYNLRQLGGTDALPRVLNVQLEAPNQSRIVETAKQEVHPLFCSLP